MSSVTEVIGRRGGSWVYYVRISGVGNDAGQYTFATGRPAFAAGNENWIVALEGIPAGLSDRISLEGGVQELGSLDLTLVDVKGRLRSIFRWSSPPIAVLTAPISMDDTTAPVGHTDNLEEGQRVWLGTEAVRITGISGLDLTISRGELGTEPQPHGEFRPIRVFPPRLEGARVEFFAAPVDSGGDADGGRIPLGEFTVIQPLYREGWGGYRLRCAAVTSSLRRYVGRAFAQQWAISQSIGRGYHSLTTLYVHDGVLWSGADVWGNDRAHFLIDDQEVALCHELIGARTPAGKLIQVMGLRLLERGVLGTESVEIEDYNLNSNEPRHRLRLILTADQTFGASDYRVIPAGSSPMTDRANALPTDHVIDLLLIHLTSSRSPADGLELRNYSTGRPNWSTLAPGYGGAGVRARFIDFESFLAIKRRFPDWRFPWFTYHRPGKLSDTLIDNFLKPLGLVLTMRNGRLTAVLPRIPDASAELPAFTLGAEARIVSRPQARGYFEERSTAKAVIIHAVTRDGRPSETLITAADLLGEGNADDEPIGPEDAIPLSISGLVSDTFGFSAFAEELAARKLLQSARPPVYIETPAPPSMFDRVPGDAVALTLPVAPRSGDGGLGWEAEPFVVLERIHHRDPADPGFSFLLAGWEGSGRVGRIAPALRVVNEPDGDWWPVAANEFCPDEGEGEDPTHDLEPFGWQVGQEVELWTFAGVKVSTTSPTVAEVDIPGNRIRLSGGFGVGGSHIDRVIKLALAGDSLDSVVSRYVASAERTTNQIPGVSISPWRYGED